MTERIYYDHGALECRAKVLACKAVENGYEILTDRTTIFPEGGGQLSDEGSIDGASISHAREEDGDVWHFTDRAFSEGAEVTLKADAAKRLDHTQQHSGEHIISGLASKLFGAHNVGFHMAADYATLDLDQALNAEQIKQLQREANIAVQSNLPVTCTVVQGEELEGMQLRKLAKGLTGDIRIVYVDAGNVDSCTCCGTHVERTGEIGYIKITAHMKYKGGTRIWFACGMRAVEEALKDKDTVDALANRFSTKPDEITAAVARQWDELSASKKALKLRTENLLNYVAAELLAGAEIINGTKLVLSCQSEMSMTELKLLSEKLTSDSTAVAMLFGGGAETLVYQLARGEKVSVSMRDMCAAVNAATGGKGGGRDNYAQGSAPKTASLNVEETLGQLLNYARSILKA